HLAIKHLKAVPYLFKKKTDKIQLVYAGAMLPKAYGPLEAIFKSIRANPAIFNAIEFHFIGTGKRPNDPESHSIKSLAEQYQLWQTNVYEYPQRIPYLDVLLHLDIADAIFILGSTEPHYTPSKTYQGVLSAKPILAVLHTASSAVKIVNDSKAGLVLDFNGEEQIELIESKFATTMSSFKLFIKNYDPSRIDEQLFDAYSAKNVTKQLAELLNIVCAK
ncbi:MAG: hypothetical protein H7320_15260, partial [Ferruginibacter sp.]|nr:hypothetical protein [Ferruginibacter sp.]